MMEIYALTLENIVEASQDSKEEVIENILKSIFNYLVKGIEKNDDVKLACLSIMTRMFKCYGQLILRTNLIDKDKCIKAIFGQMNDGKTS